MAEVSRRSRTATPVQMAAVVVGGGFLAVGVLGFIPGVAEDYDQMDSPAMSPRPSDWLHLGLAAGMLLLGVTLGGGRSTTAR